jgi:hypothetical protein
LDNIRWASWSLKAGTRATSDQDTGSNAISKMTGYMIITASGRATRKKAKLSRSLTRDRSSTFYSSIQMGG